MGEVEGLGGGGGAGEFATGEVFGAAAFAGGVGEDAPEEGGHVQHGGGVLGEKEVAGFGAGQEGDDALVAGEGGGKQAEVVRGGVSDEAGDDNEGCAAVRVGLESNGGLGGGELLEGAAEGQEMGVALGEQTLGGGEGVFGGGVEGLREVAKAEEIGAGEAFGARPADELNAPVLADFGTLANEEEADLAGRSDVRAAAGLQIRAGDFDDAEETFARDLFADAQFGELFAGGVANDDGAVLENNFIGGALGAFENGVGRLRAVQIDGAGIPAEVEGNGGQAEAFLKHGGEKMLTGVLLHVVEAAVPIDATGDGRRGGLAVDDMDDVVALVADFEDVAIAEFAEVVRLAAGRGI